ncbi:MAG: galE6 [Microbacteriaceae bacterium]|nr:galE6 [Microbacteriaceae bacterium]
MHYLITGHTGFKGAWLSLLLSARGHTVSGLALDPTPGALFETAGVDSILANDERIDIRDAAQTARAVQTMSPDVVIHLAAQALVRDSYRDPRTTFDTNVMGTLNVLEAVGATPSVKAHVVITTDKVYRNVNRAAGYVESDALGGADPYSASKAMADILTQSWITSFGGTPTAIARAGNVIGGGDVSRDRLLPDLLSAFTSGTPAPIRYPDSVRPWQHVLDCLDGYLTLADALLDGGGLGEWNFGPGEESFVTVANVADRAAALWGAGASWVRDEGDHPHEAGLLALDSTKAERELGWRNRLPFPLSLEWSVDWQRQSDDASAVTRSQIATFDAL